MVFAKSYPKQIPGSNYPIWEEVTLSDEEEKEVEDKLKKENFLIMDESIGEARALAIKNSMNTEENVTKIAIALFEKRASHLVFLKENKTKEKFDEMQKQQ